MKNTKAKTIQVPFYFMILTLFSALLSVSSAHAKRIVVTDRATVVESPEVKEAPTGRQEASKYFSRSPAAESSGGGSRDHYLGLHVGGFVSSESYVWGRQEKSEETGKTNLGVTYRMDEWIGSADMLLRADFTTYSVDEYKPLKLSVIFAAAFPDANSRFPLYFGAGIGPGIFFKQARTESPISLDYQLFTGVRFFDVFDSIGFSLEGGMKNHLHLLSDGQFNSVFITAGVLFTF